jgi:predicted nuclease of predicted toxin-antitoxin system
MRFLADAGVSPKTVEFLKKLGHEAIHVFGDILALGVLDRPSAIIFRLTDERADSVNQRLSTVLAERLADLQSGVLVLVEDTRYRIRKLPIGRT